ncbi:MAG: gliding motility-associated C-terminal domain-containing protein [Elusimicrobiota bacterium]
MRKDKFQITNSKFQTKSKTIPTLLFVFLSISYLLSPICLFAVPANISDLTALPGSNEGELVLQWTAPGKDGTLATVYGYMVTYSTKEVITRAGFSIATPYPHAWTGLVSGNKLESRLLTGLAPNQWYYFAIISSGSGGWSVWNSSIDVAGINLGAANIVKWISPDTITNLSVTPGYKKAILTWTAPGDDNTIGPITNGQFEVRYSIQQQIVNENDWNSILTQYRVVIPTSTSPSVSQSYTVTALTNGTTYYFAIKTRDENATGWSAIDITSPEPSATPFNNPPFDFATVSPSNGTIVTTTKPSFDWQDTTDPDGEGIASYSIEYSFYSDFPYPPGEKGPLSYSSYTFVEPLSDDKTYYWRAKAIDMDLGITYSTSSVVHINIANSAPTDFNLLSPNNETVLKRPTFSWNASDDPDPPWNINYTIYYSSTSNFSTYLTTTTTNTSFLFTTNLIENTTYYWKVIASDEYISPAVTTSTLTGSFYVKPVLPSAPANVKITDGIISWDTVLLDEDGTPIVDFATYKIYQSADIKNIGAAQTFAGYTTTTSTPAVSGLWTVIRAVDEFGNESANSIAVNPSEPNQCLLSKQQDLLIEIPAAAQSTLSDVIISITKTGQIYEIKPLNNSSLTEIPNFQFPTPVKITFETDDDCVYWHNSVEYVALGGKKDKSITIQTTKLGLFYTGKIETPKLKLISAFPKKIFTPNNDGINDEINLIFTGITEENVEGEVFDITGKKVAILTKKDFSWFAWDGKKSDGKIVLPGVYIYQIKNGKNVCNGTIVVAR